MFSNRIFQIALLLSLLIHVLILTQNPNFRLLQPKNGDRKVAVRYVKSRPGQTKILPRVPALHKEPLFKIPDKITVAKGAPPPYIDRQNSTGKDNVSGIPKANFDKPVFIRPDISAIKKKITLPPIDMNKINNPTYISYYQLVREKIRRCAYRNYSGAETGDVYISFIISDNGYLKDEHIIDEKTSANMALREIALRSVNEASPFPNFPKELDYPQLSFNVIISFEVE